jgi:hypothetical protein
MLKDSNPCQIEMMSHLCAIGFIWLPLGKEFANFITLRKKREGRKGEREK